MSSGVFHSDTAGLSESIDETFRQAIPVSAGQLDTGVYELSVEITSHYPRSSRSTPIKTNVVVNNQKESAIGAGWMIAGLNRLYEQEAGNVLLVNGEGDAYDYRQGGDPVQVPGDANIFGAGRTIPTAPGGGGGGTRVDLPPKLGLLVS